jgi:hypothetical protein
MLSELVACFLRRLGGDHHSGAIGELGDQRRERRLQHELDGQGIDDVDMVEGGQFRFSERPLH